MDYSHIPLKISASTKLINKENILEILVNQAKKVKLVNFNVRQQTIER